MTVIHRLAITALLVLAPVLLRPGAAFAHPHVWVEVETTIVFESGSITGLRHRWIFDEAYSTMATEGLDANKDGTYTSEELGELAKVNIDGLKEFGYFTVAKLGDQALKYKEPTEYHLEYKDKALTLVFTLPLEQPVLQDAQGFAFAVFDETFFIAFDFTKENPVKLAGAPQGCEATVAVPQNELDQLKALNESFGGQLTAGNQNMGLGAGYAKTVTLGCKKS